MKYIDRRTLLARAAALIACTGGYGCATQSGRWMRDVAGAGEEFPVVEPAEVGVSEERLAEAVAFVDAAVQAGAAPGAALVATRRGRKFVEHYCGTYRSLDGENAPYHTLVSSPLFSFSKGITATVAVMAHQDGLIDYDIPVCTYIPEFSGGGKDTITLRHLLTHSAGIPSVSGGAASTDEGWRQFLAMLCAATLEWPAGSRTAYHSVSGMFLVAEAVRRVSDMKPWDLICRERLFEPIGAQSLGFAAHPAEFPLATAPSYFPTLDRFALAGHPAGGCFGTADDMLRVLNLIVHGGMWHGKRIIQRNAVDEMLTVQFGEQIAEAVAAGVPPAHESWGLGWLVRGTAPECPAGPWFGFGDSTSPTLFGHAGVDTVFGDGDPARDLAFVFITTDKAKDASEATRLRREVSNLLQAAVLLP